MGGHVAVILTIGFHVLDEVIPDIPFPHDFAPVFAFGLHLDQAARPDLIALEKIGGSAGGEGISFFAASFASLPIRSCRRNSMR